MSELYLVSEAMEKNLAGKGNRGYWGGIREGGQGRLGEGTFELKAWAIWVSGGEHFKKINL